MAAWAALLASHPFAVTVRNSGHGVLRSNVERARPGQTVRLTKEYGSSVKSIKGADFSGNLSDGYTFVMPRGNVNIEVEFEEGNGLLQTAGTESAPYIINSTERWDEFVWRVNHGNSFSGKYLQLDADITITKTAGLYGDNPFSGTFLGNGHTLMANLSSTTTGTGWNEEGVAPFHYIKDATVKDLTVAGTIASASYHTAGIVGFAFGTNLIEGCTVTATLNQNNNYAGGIIGHGENSATTIKDCVFAGTINGVGGNRSNIGGIWGWSDTGSPVIQNCLEAGTYNNISSMHPMGLYGASCSISGGYYMNPQIGTPDQVSTVTGATQVSTTEPTGELYQSLTINGRTFCVPCTLSGNDVYTYTGNEITIDEPTVTGTAGTTLTKGTDYTYTVAPATVKDMGVYTVTFSGNGSTCYGSKTVQIYVLDGNIAGTLSSGKYMINADLTVEDRITISGNVVLHLGEGATLTAKKGIELSGDNRLTIWGPGALVIDKCDDGKSGIGAATAGILTINGGQLTISGGANAAGIGSDAGYAASGKLTLGWTYSDNYIDCSSYSVSSEYFRFNDSFIIDGKQTIATTANIGGRKAVPAVVLTDNGDNSATLFRSNNKQVTAALDGRTLYLDGDWNTLCLPFDYDISGLKGVEARTLTSASIEETTLNLTFGNPVNTLEAGVPYIIKFDLSSEYAVDDDVDFSTLTLVNPVFEGVTINNTEHNYDNDVSGNKRVRFVGTYAKKSFSEDKSILFMGAANTLYYPLDGASIGAQRAYFKIGEDDAEAPASIRAFVLNFGDDDTTGVEGVIEVNEVSGVNGVDDDSWYSLDGRKLGGKPSRAGVYINKGIKVVLSALSAISTGQ